MGERRVTADGRILEMQADGSIVQVGGGQQGIQTSAPKPSYQYEGTIAQNKAAASAYDDDIARARLTDSAASRNLAREKFEFDKQQAAQKASQEAGKQSAPMTAVQRADAIKGYQDAIALDSKIANLEKLYQKGPGSTGAATGFTDFLPTEANKDFNAAANAMRGTIKGVLGFTGGEVNSAAEAEFNLGPYIPSASNYDSTIEGTIQRLKDEAKTAKAKSIAILGGTPDQFGNITRQNETPASNVPPQSNGLDQTQQRAVGASAQQMAPSSNGYETVDNPELAGANETVAQMLLQGAGTSEIAGYLKSRGVNPLPMMGAIRANVEFQKKNPGVAPQVNVDDMAQPLSAVDQVRSDMADSAGGAYAVGASNALTAGYLDEMAGGNAQQNKEYLRSQYPGASLGGDVSGAVMAMLPAGAAVKAATGLSAGKAAIAGDMAYGGLYGSGEANGGLTDRAVGAATGAAAAGIGGSVGNKVTGMFGRGVRGIRNATTRKLGDAGVPMTVGQMVGNGGMVGRTLKGVEDKLASIPMVGDAINARRNDSFEGFNRAAFDEALAPIGKTVPEIGEAGIGQAKQAASQGYDDALSGVSINADDQFAQDMIAANQLGSQTPDFGPQYTNIMDRKISPIAMGGDAIDGKQFQNLRRAADGYGRKYNDVANGMTPQPMAEDVSSAFYGVRDALDGVVERNNPGVLPAYQAANKAYGNVNTLRDAVSKGKNSEGIFSPAQLTMAGESSARKYGGKHGTTERPFFDLARAGQETLPSQVPNSGTADRAIVTALLPAALGGAGYGTGMIDPTTAMGVASLGLPYSQAGRKVLQKTLMDRPQPLIDAGEAIYKNRRIGGMFGAAPALTLSQR